MSPHLSSAELQPWSEFCSLLKNNWGQRGGLDVTHHQPLASPVTAAAWVGCTVWDRHDCSGEGQGSSAPFQLLRGR